MTTETTRRIAARFVPPASREEIALREAQARRAEAEARVAPLSEAAFLGEDVDEVAYAAGLQTLWTAQEREMWAEEALAEHKEAAAWYATQGD